MKRQSPQFQQGKTRTVDKLVRSWASGCGLWPGNILSKIRARPKQTYIFHSDAQFSVEGTLTYGAEES